MKNSEDETSFWRRLNKKQLQALRGGDDDGGVDFDTLSDTSTGAAAPPPTEPPAVRMIQ